MLFTSPFIIQTSFIVTKNPYDKSYPFTHGFSSNHLVLKEAYKYMYGYGGYGYGGGGGGFALIVVLFILLIIVGTSFIGFWG